MIRSARIRVVGHLNDYAITDNRENKPRPVAMGVPCLLEIKIKNDGGAPSLFGSKINGGF